MRGTLVVKVFLTSAPVLTLGVTWFPGAVAVEFLTVIFFDAAAPAVVAGTRVVAGLRTGVLGLLIVVIVASLLGVCMRSLDKGRERDADLDAPNVTLVSTFLTGF